MKKFSVQLSMLVLILTCLIFSQLAFAYRIPKKGVQKKM